MRTGSEGRRLRVWGVDLIREYAKAPNFFITEINGNPGTVIIDITGYNHFVDLVKYIETKSG